MEKLCHLLLGTSGTGRRELLAILAAQALEDGPVAVLFAGSETLLAASATLPEGALLGTWHLHSNSPREPGTLEPNPAAMGASTLFLVSDGRANPVDFLEAVALWLPGSGFSLGRILTLVNCGLAEQHPKARHYYAACIHFSDYVLLTKREGVSNKWIADFQRQFKDACYPCHFEILKASGVRNPAFILSPESRRMSQAFDEFSAPPEELPEDVRIFDEDTGEDVTEESTAVDPDDAEAPVSEPYFERMPNGRRLKEVPDIEDLLEKVEA